MELTTLMRTNLENRLVKAGVSPDTVDIEALWDNTLTYEENLAEFECFIAAQIQVNKDFEAHMADEAVKFNADQQFKENSEKLPNLDEIKTLGIIGDRNSGKTSIMVTLARNYKGKRTVVFYAYPDKTLPYKQIHTIHELELLTDAIVFMSELQKHIKFYVKNTSDEFMDVLSTLSHNNVTLVFDTPMSQFITKGLDCFMDGFIYTKIGDMGALKNGSKAKRMLQEFSSERISKRTVRLSPGEYLQIIDGQEASNGLHIFANPNITKAWRNAEKTQEKCEEKATEKAAQ